MYTKYLANRCTAGLENTHYVAHAVTKSTMLKSYFLLLWRLMHFPKDRSSHRDNTDLINLRGLI